MERYFDENEVVKAPAMVRDLMREMAGIVRDGDFGLVKTMISDAIGKGHYRRDRYGINPVIHSLETSLALCRMVSPDRNMVLAVMLYNLTGTDFISDDEMLRLWGDDVMALLSGLRKVARLYSKQAAVESDNFRKLLLTFAKDIRVIIIMIVDRLVLMRAINHHPDEKFVHDVAYEANYLYAPLAHRLGLYKIKGELEDMSLKYTDREKYSEIARKLNQTKVAREAYIAEFIAPIRERLEREGLSFELKGRTKSIYSIWNKMRKQKNDVEDIYDLFAIRIILDVPPRAREARLLAGVLDCHRHVRPQSRPPQRLALVSEKQRL